MQPQVEAQPQGKGMAQPVGGQLRRQLGGNGLALLQTLELLAEYFARRAVLHHAVRQSVGQEAIDELLAIGRPASGGNSGYAALARAAPAVALGMGDHGHGVPLLLE